MSPTLAARRARHALWVFITVGSMSLILGLVFGGATLLDLTQTVRDTQIEGTPTGRKLLAASDRILDCTDPGDVATSRPPGECFTQSQERTATSVGDINRVVILAAACAAGLPDGLSENARVIRTQDCVIRQLTQPE